MRVCCAVSRPKKGDKWEYDTGYVTEVRVLLTATLLTPSCLLAHSSELPTRHTDNTTLNNATLNLHKVQSFSRPMCISRNGCTHSFVSLCSGAQDMIRDRLFPAGPSVMAGLCGPAPMVNMACLPNLKVPS